VFTKPSSQTCLQSDASRTFPSFEPRKFPTSTQIQIHLRRRRKRVSHTLRTRRLSLRCTPNSPRDREDPLLRYRRQVPLQICSLTRLTLARRPSHHVPAPEHRQSILQRAAAQSSTCRPPYTQSPSTNHNFPAKRQPARPSRIRNHRRARLQSLRHHMLRLPPRIRASNRQQSPHRVTLLHFQPLPLALTKFKSRELTDRRYLQQHLHLNQPRHRHCAKRWRNIDHPAFLVLHRVLHIDVRSS
jgi:hypothetical protein